MKITDLEQLKPNELSEFIDREHLELCSRSDFRKIRFWKNKLIEKSPIEGTPIFKESYLEFSENVISFIRLEGLPDATSLSFLQDFENYLLNFEKVEKEKAKNHLDLARRQNHAALFSNIKDIEGVEGHRENEDLLERLIKGEEAIFKLECWIIVHACKNDKEDLTNKIKKTKSALKSIGVTPIVETLGLRYAYENLISEKNSPFILSHLVNSTYLLNFLPLQRCSLHREGIEFKSTRDESIFFDLFNPDSLNFNALISGASGSGKSFLANKIIHEQIDRDTKTIIIDRGGSFEGLSFFHEGLNHQGSFDPLISFEPQYIFELIKSVIPKGDLSKRDLGELLEFIKSRRWEDCESFKDVLEVIFKEYNELKFYFSDILEYLTDTKYPETNLLYVDLEDYPEAILPILIVYLIKRLDLTKGRKLLILDECHYLLENNASFIEKNFRELRKKNGGVIALTQNFEDFSHSKIGRVIANNSFYKFFFKQNLHQSEWLDSFDLSRISFLKGEKGVFSEFYLKSFTNFKIIRFNASKLEKKLFSSTYEEKRDFFLKWRNSSLSFRDFTYSLIHSFILLALSLPVNGFMSEEIALFEIVSNTAAQLNELEELVTNTQKHTKKLSELNEIATDKLYSAERVELWASDMETLLDHDEEGLAGLNSRISAIKMKREDITEILKDISRDVLRAENEEIRLKDQRLKQKRIISLNKRQSLRSINNKGDALKLTAQNTGTTALEVSKTNALILDQNLTLKKIQGSVQKSEMDRFFEKEGHKKAYELNKGKRR